MVREYVRELVDGILVWKNYVRHDEFNQVCTPFCNLNATGCLRLLVASVTSSDVSNDDVVIGSVEVLGPGCISL